MEVIHDGNKVIAVKKNKRLSQDMIDLYVVLETIMIEQILSDEGISQEDVEYLKQTLNNRRIMHSMLADGWKSEYTEYYNRALGVYLGYDTGWNKENCLSMFNSDAPAYSNHPLSKEEKDMEKLFDDIFNIGGAAWGFGNGSFKSTIVRRPDKEEQERLYQHNKEMWTLEDLGVIPKLYDFMYEGSDTAMENNDTSNVYNLAPNDVHKYVLAEIKALEYTARHGEIPADVVNYLKSTLSEREQMHNQIDAGTLKLTEEDNRALDEAMEKYNKRWKQGQLDRRKTL